MKAKEIGEVLKVKEKLEQGQALLAPRVNMSEDSGPKRSLGLEESYWARGQASINRVRSGKEGVGIILRRKIFGNEC